MNLFIKIYILLCVALILFDLVFLVVKNIKTYEFYPRNSQFEDRIRAEIALHRETNSFSKGFFRDLPQLLSKTKNLVTLQSELEKTPEASPWFRSAVFDQINTYQKKSDYEQAFYTYVISRFDYSNAPVPPSFADRFMSFLDSKSLYTFSNTMNAIYRFGHVNLILLGIEKTDERGRFYHKKLLTDGILASQVDQAELVEKLVDRFHWYSSHMQECLLDIFRMGRGDAADLCMELMLNTNLDDQIRYSAMRYFIKHPNDPSREFFLSILKNENAAWVEQMLAIQCLANYRDEDIYQSIKSKATSRHWYVRTNAVEYLFRQGISREEITEILQTQDKYASEALLYQYRDDHDMTMFMIRTIQQIASQSNQQVLEQSAIEKEVTASSV